MAESWIALWVGFNVLVLFFVSRQLREGLRDWQWVQRNLRNYPRVDQAVQEASAWSAVRSEVSRIAVIISFLVVGLAHFVHLVVLSPLLVLLLTPGSVFLLAASILNHRDRHRALSP